MKKKNDDGTYDLYSKDGTKRLGKNMSEEEVKKREQEVNYFKLKNKVMKK